MSKEIKGLENMSVQQLNQEVMRGGKFVIFEYCISVLILTFKNGSSIYYIRPEEGTVGKSLPFTIVSLFLGWWGFPWGPIYTIGSLITNLGGGKDVTTEVMNSLNTVQRTQA